MTKISDKASPKVIKIVASTWFGVLIIVSLFVGIRWTLTFFLFGIFLYFLYEKKVKDVFLDCDSIIVEHQGELIKVGFSEISGVDNRSILKGCYKISFKVNTKMGKFIYFTPRSKGIFDVHESVELFAKKFRN